MALKFGTIKQTAFIPATPHQVYEALLDPKKHSEFTGSPATANSKIGVEFNAWDGYISGKNIELSNDKKIVQEWETTGWPEGYPRSRLELTLTPKKGGTELKMVHSNVPVLQVKGYTSGWPEFYWDPLKRYFAPEKPKRKVKKAD